MGPPAPRTVAVSGKGTGKLWGGEGRHSSEGVAHVGLANFHDLPGGWVCTEERPKHREVRGPAQGFGVWVPLPFPLTGLSAVRAERTSGLDGRQPRAAR